MDSAVMITAIICVTIIAICIIATIDSKKK